MSQYEDVSTSQISISPNPKETLDYSKDNEESKGRMSEDANLLLENESLNAQNEKIELWEQNEHYSEEVSMTSEENPPIENQDPGKKEKIINQYLQVFLQELEQIGDNETKLHKTIEFMEASLAQIGSPHFKSFWEARNICLQLFKENISPSTRSLLWSKYSELSREARRLKEILDEQSAFAVEQIEIAVQALETDIAQFDDHLTKMHPIEFSAPCQTLQDHLHLYQKIQQELNLLNAQASRINALRKELIKTEMRVRQKNKFFQRLSIAGDKVFPRRKELIKEISQHFIEDVDSFISRHFSDKEIHESLFFLREEIKALQGMAKVLTLNTHSFTHTRTKLSECWDKIKGLEKERKKVRAQQKQTFKQNADEILAKIAELNQNFQANQINVAEANKIIEEIVSQMRKVDLGRDEIKFLREELNNVRKPILEKIKADEQVRLDIELQHDRQRKKKYQDLREEIDSLLKAASQFDADKVTHDRDAILDKVNSSSYTKSEKQELERQLKPLRDIILEKKEQALMTLSEDDRQSIQQLKEILKQRKDRRQEIKNQIEVYRKASGSSGLDFEQAMSFNTQLNGEKERLEKINQGIKEIEQKIVELSSKSQK